MEMLPTRAPASTIGCGSIDDAASEAELNGTIVTQLPDPSLGVPLHAGLLHSIADCHVGKGNA